MSVAVFASVASIAQSMNAGRISANGIRLGSRPTSLTLRSAIAPGYEQEAYFRALNEARAKEEREAKEAKRDAEIEGWAAEWLEEAAKDEA